jgi:hypothetical protein
MDNRIKRIESAAKHNEPKRVASAQALKAAGSSSGELFFRFSPVILSKLTMATAVDTYTETELKRASLWCMTDFKGPRNVFVGLRDRAMLLFSATTAVRGESARILLWSDLFISEIPLDDVRQGLKIPVSDRLHLRSRIIMTEKATSKVLAALADNAKHNQNGRIDENGAIRHRDVELCPVGALAMKFFAYFHILGKELPNFAPDFNNTEFGEYGCREWYDLFVFWGEDPKKEMSYDSECYQRSKSDDKMTHISFTDHHTRVKLIHIKNDICITKVTHAGRCYAAQNARAHGASITGTKALGGWNESGSFRNCYDRAFPVDALLGAAAFNARRPEQYCLPRSSLGKAQPPALDATNC